GTVVKVPSLPEKEEPKVKDYEIYTVKRGGRLEHVAKSLGIPEKELERLNPELKGRWLKKGTVVEIPVKDKAPTALAKEREAQPIQPQIAEVGEPEEQTLNLADVGISKNSLPMPVEGEMIKSNRGVNILAQCEAPVRVVESGRVIYSGGDLQAYGNMVIVDHGEFISLYAHNQTNLVKRGEQVSKNQEIALVGRKGNSENCLLYFELRNKEGVPMDPTEYFRSAE
ncbi:peptidoglycan DD-metalloendopeptidase family protein, partial [Thermocrinis sp.]